MKKTIAWMARNSVAANLLMLLILIVGLGAYTILVQEVFPQTAADSVEIRVEYPGASPEEVERSIVLRIEDQIESLEGIKDIVSTAAENFAVVNVSLRTGEDLSERLDEIKAEIDRIITFPEDAEKPTIKALTPRSQSIQLAVYGDVSEKALKETAYLLKDELTALPKVSFVDVSGVRNYEISIEVSEAQSRAFGLSLADVAQAVRVGSLDLPGGSVETQGEEILIRTEGQLYRGDEFSEIIVKALPNGAVVRLDQVAQIIDGFQEADLIMRYNGQPTVLVNVLQTSSEQVLDVVASVKDEMKRLQASVPAGISVDVWQDNAQILQSRLSLLIKNGFFGLMLVILVLAFFLDLRLAFWVSVGLFISFVGAFAVMVATGTSINLLSLLAFILALGIVVDDAIVVGENTYALHEGGLDPMDAAITGTQRLRRPVIFAVLTTVTAFSPLLFVPGAVGKLFEAIPVVVIGVLVLSLVESLFVLPTHLGHSIGKSLPDIGFFRWFTGVQDWVASTLARFIEGPVSKLLRFSTKRYGLVIAIAVAMIIVTFGMVAGGIIKFTFLPVIEGENVIAKLEMPQGTSAEETERVTARIEAAGWEAANSIVSGADDEVKLVETVYTSVGTRPSLAQGPGGVTDGLVQSHIAEVNFRLTNAETRDIPASRFAQEWRTLVGDVPGANSLQFQSELISFGNDIEAELSASDPVILADAVEAFKDSLATYGGISEIQDDDRNGKRELKLSLRPSARSLGVTLDDLARQVRGGFYGYEVTRLQRGSDDVKVMVRLPLEERDALSDIEGFRIRTPGRAEIPLSEVAKVAFGYGSSSINRRDRRRVVTVSADVDESVANVQEVIASIKSSVVPSMAKDFSGLQVGFEGQQRELADTISAILRGFAVAMFVIYMLLAIPFKSYLQPFIVMSAIPFGIIGAILGHLILGMDLSLPSIFGIVGLSGVVVNDSLVFIDFVNENRAHSPTMRDAVIEAGKQRFRPILLTSLTTFAGVLPLVLETSLQAQFLIPIAASLGFGILFGTVIIMSLVPALAMLVDQISTYFAGQKKDTSILAGQLQST